MTSLTANQARDAIYKRWSTRWTLTPFAFEGEASKLDEGSVAYALVGARHETRQGDGQSTMGPAGSRRFFRTGRIWIKLFVPADSGIKVLDGMGHTARGIFEAVRFSGVRTHSAIYRESQVEGKFLTGMVETEFDYQEIK